MGMIRVAANRRIDAPVDRVYRYIADYRTHHPAFLPPAFSNFAVEEGGVGAGTVIHFTLRAGGKTQTFRQRVSEPDPGRVLTETTIGTQNATSFRVNPEGTGSRVEIVTEYEGAEGLRGIAERLLAPLVLRRIYADELRRLDRYVAEQAA